MFAAAGTILGFVPMQSRPEADLRPLLRAALAAGKRVALPRVQWAARQMSAHVIADVQADLEPVPGPVAGLWQPAARCPELDAGAIELLLAPGLGFDEAGGRIGHGAGFYDRFLARAGSAAGRCVVCGVGFEAQVLEPGRRVPREPHDRVLDALATQSRLVVFGNGPHAEPRGPG